MWLAKDRFVITLFTIIISGAAGGLIATLYNAYYYELLIKSKGSGMSGCFISKKKDVNASIIYGEEKEAEDISIKDGTLIDKSDDTDEDRFYQELKDEIEVQEK